MRATKAKPSDIWKMHSRGFTNVDVANKLKVSEGAVRYHLKKEKARRANILDENKELAVAAVKIDIDRQVLLNEILQLLKDCMHETPPSDLDSVSVIVRLINDTVRTSKLIEPVSGGMDLPMVVPELIKMFMGMDDVTIEGAIQKFDKYLTT